MTAFELTVDFFILFMEAAGIVLLKYLKDKTQFSDIIIIDIFYYCMLLLLAMQVFYLFRINRGAKK